MFNRVWIAALAAASGMFLPGPVGVALGQWCPLITEPEPLNTNAASDSGSDGWVQLTTDGQGNWVAVWQSSDTLGGTIGTDNDILFCRSMDNGVTWTAPTPLNTNAVSDGGSDNYAQLTTDGQGNWVAVWHSSDDLGGTIGTDQDILFTRSTDYGSTWTAPAPLNTNAATDSGHDSACQLTTDGQGNWLAVWESYDDLGGTIGTDKDVLFSRSVDDGTTWTAPLPLNTNGVSDSGYDARPQLTADTQGNWVALWYSDDDLGGAIGTDADVLFSRSTDNGATWTAPLALNTNAASDSADDLQPQLTTDGQGNWLAVWGSGEAFVTDFDILFSHSTDSGAIWSDPAALNTNAAIDSGYDTYPQLTTDGQGNWVAVWRSNDDLGGTIGPDVDVLFSRSADNGASWTAPACLNTNATSDSGSDEYPQLTTDDQGNWVAVWHSTDTLGGTIGTDRDILVARLEGDENDCNGNGVPDACDIADGTSEDCNHNQIPDECDIASGSSVDNNGNGVPDECEAPELWDVTVVDSEGNVGKYTSVAILPSGYPAISYYGGYVSYGLLYAWYDGSAWQTTVVESGSGVGLYTSLAILPSGYPAISYAASNDDLKYAWYDGGAWQTVVVDTDLGWYCGHTSLAILPSGRPAISYYDDTNDDLKYGELVGSDPSDPNDWETCVVDFDGNVGKHNSLAILPLSEQPAISYYDQTNWDLKYAWHDGSVWRTTVVDNVSGWYSAGLTSLAILPSGQPAIAYLSYDLRYAWHDGSAWHTTDAVDQGGGYISLAIRAGQPVISYYDSFDDDLKYAWYDGSVWHTMIVDRAGHVGEYSSLAVLPSGQPAISYYDYSNGDLRFATGAEVVPAPVAMLTSYTARAWTELGGETLVDDGPAYNEGYGLGDDFPAHAESSVSLETTSGGHLRGLIDLVGRDGMTIYGDPNWPMEEWFSCEDASGTAIGTLEIGTSGDYPAGSELELALKVVVGGYSGDAEGYHLQLWRDGSLIAHIDPNAPDAADVAVEAAETLSFELFALEEDWDGDYSEDYDRGFEFRFILRAPPIPGDVDGDGDVDLSDLAALLAAYGSNTGDPNYNPDADLDDDGDVDLADLAMLLANYGTGT